MCHKVQPNSTGFPVTNFHLFHYLLYLLESSYLTISDIMKGSGTKKY